MSRKGLSAEAIRVLVRESLSEVWEKGAIRSGSLLWRWRMIGEEKVYGPYDERQMGR